MPHEEEELVCYNKGCGKMFLEKDNKEDSCVHHPGVPFFHDAYKGWTCCNKKCTDFTEFLNFKGCTKSFHTNVKPPEPEKPAVEKLGENEVIEVRAPIPNSDQGLPRPHFTTPLVLLQSIVSPSLAQQAKSLITGRSKEAISDVIQIGTSCKNGGCKAAYEGPDKIHSLCTHHPGYPVFHEGLKYWTCCQRKTSDFNTFLEQQGCREGDHVWVKAKAEGDCTLVQCRLDWHQTAVNVVVSIFAKKYDPTRSKVELSPVRLKVHLYFPEEECSYDLDVELRGVVDVAKSKSQMFATKLEVSLHKAEPGSWTKLDFPVDTTQIPDKKVELTVESISTDFDDAVDLSDIC